MLGHDGGPCDEHRAEKQRARRPAAGTASRCRTTPPSTAISPICAERARTVTRAAKPTPSASGESAMAGRHGRRQRRRSADSHDRQRQRSAMPASPIGRAPMPPRVRRWRQFGQPCLRWRARRRGWGPTENGRLTHATRSSQLTICLVLTALNLLARTGSGQPGAIRGPGMILKSGVATSVGSLPHHDPVAAVELELARHPDLPASPWLPRRSLRERLISRAAVGVAGLGVDDDGSLIVDIAALDPDAPPRPCLPARRFWGSPQLPRCSRRSRGPHQAADHRTGVAFAGAYRRRCRRLDIA